MNKKYIDRFGSDENINVFLKNVELAKASLDGKMDPFIKAVIDRSTEGSPKKSIDYTISLFNFVSDELKKLLEDEDNDLEVLFDFYLIFVEAFFHGPRLVKKVMASFIENVEGFLEKEEEKEEDRGDFMSLLKAIPPSNN